MTHHDPSFRFAFSPTRRLRRKLIGLFLTLPLAAGVVACDLNYHVVECRTGDEIDDVTRAELVAAAHAAFDAMASGHPPSVTPLVLSPDDNPLDDPESLEKFRPWLAHDAAPEVIRVALVSGRVSSIAEREVYCGDIESTGESNTRFTTTVGAGPAALVGLQHQSAFGDVTDFLAFRKVEDEWKLYGATFHLASWRGQPATAWMETAQRIQHDDVTGAVFAALTAEAVGATPHNYRNQTMRRLKNLGGLTLERHLAAAKSDWTLDGEPLDVQALDVQGAIMDGNMQIFPVVDVALVPPNDRDVLDATARSIAAELVGRSPMFMRNFDHVKVRTVRDGEVTASIIVPMPEA